MSPKNLMPGRTYQGSNIVILPGQGVDVPMPALDSSKVESPSVAKGIELIVELDVDGKALPGPGHLYQDVGNTSREGNITDVVVPQNGNLEDGESGSQPRPKSLTEKGSSTSLQHPGSFQNLSTTTLQSTTISTTMSTITTTAWQTSFPPILPEPFNANQPKAIRLFPLSNYTFGTKETQPEEDPSVLARLKRLEEHYEQHGMRRTCEGILVCHEHNHPHILMLQIANAFFKLPGDYLMPDDDEVEGFKSRLNERLAPVGTQFSGEGVNEEWEIGDTLAQWWRPNFETFMYPFIPAHVTRPKECKKLYFIQLPRQKVLSVPKNMKLLAVPLFELYDNTARYGPQLSAIPHLLSRYNFEFVDENGNIVAVTPGGGPAGYVPKTKILAGGTDEEMKEGGQEDQDVIQ